MTGRRAPPHEHQRIAYLLTRFSPLVTAIQHLSLYHAGEGLVCEVDIVLPPDTSLPIAHNLGEACQYAIEQLSGIERAFVWVAWSPRFEMPLRLTDLAVSLAFPRILWRYALSADDSLRPDSDAAPAHAVLRAGTSMSR